LVGLEPGEEPIGRAVGLGLRGRQLAVDSLGVGRAGLFQLAVGVAEWGLRCDRRRRLLALVFGLGLGLGRAARVAALRSAVEALAVGLVLPVDVLAEAVFLRQRGHLVVLR